MIVLLSQIEGLLVRLGVLEDEFGLSVYREDLRTAGANSSRGAGVPRTPLARRASRRSMEGGWRCSLPRR
jgi:hypothetical protein